MNKNLRAFWDEICLPENQDIRDCLFRLDYTWIEEDPNGYTNRFEEIQEEREYAEENYENFTKTREGWKFSYIVKNSDWLFVKASEVYGILFDDAMVNKDTEMNADYMNLDLWNYPFWQYEGDTWESLIIKKEKAFPNYREILNKYFKICDKYGLILSVGKTESSSLTYEEFDALVYKDFKGE